MVKQLALTAMFLIGGAILLLTGDAAAQTGGSLANTGWTLAETAVQRAAFVPAVGNPLPTLVFGSDGKVSGNAGCNSYGGPYTQSGAELKIGPLFSTLRACADENLTKQEELMLRVLNGQDGKVAFTYNGVKLSLSAPAGALNFVASSTAGGSSGPNMPPTGQSGPASPVSGWPALLLVLVLLLALSGTGYLLTRSHRRQ
jgi:heat shock protein HslJ